MNIFEVTYDYPPNCMWGTGIHVGYLSGSLALNGHCVTVITRNNALQSVDAECSFGRPRIIRCAQELDFAQLFNQAHPTHSFKSIDGILKFCDVVARYVLTNCTPPDVIHNHTWFTYPIARELSEQWNVPIVSTVHLASSQYVNSGLKHTQLNGWHAMTAIEEVWLNRSQKVIVPTSMLKMHLEGDYPSLRGKIVVIEHPSPPGPIKEDYSKHVPFRILTVGRLRPEKGFQALIEALKLIAAPDMKWIAIGDGQLLTPFKLLTNGLDVNWVGRLGSDEVRQQYCEADVIVVPSLTETYGLVVREAMQAGLPIIASKIPAFEDQIVDGDSGVLIPLVQSSNGMLMNPFRLAEALVTLANSKIERRRLGRNALARAQQRNDINKYLTHVIEIMSLSK